MRIRYGYRRITVLLRREGGHINAKRVYRLYKEMGLHDEAIKAFEHVLVEGKVVQHQITIPEGLTAEQRDMQAWVQRLFTWRKANRTIHEGQLMQYAPQQGCYVFFRYDAGRTVMVVLNKNSKPVDLALDRFTERLRGGERARDVYTLDSRVRGHSDYDKDWRNYDPRIEAQDAVAFTGSAYTGQILKRTPAMMEHNVRFNQEADSLNFSMLGPDARPGTEEFDLFVKEVAREMTVKAGQKCTAIRRAFVPEQSRPFDPFLMLVEFGPCELHETEWGFGPHPHKGFETITYQSDADGA